MHEDLHKSNLIIFCVNDRRLSLRSLSIELDEVPAGQSGANPCAYDYEFSCSHALN